jgi:ubiquinone/menaquinone biosynthesis methyltransferase
MPPTNATTSRDATVPGPSTPAAVAWDDQLLRNPHAVADKQRRVRQMFAAIAPSYDLNNRVHSLGVDQYWRRRAVKLSDLKPTDRVVDVACGTGDLTIAFARELVRYHAGDIRREPYAHGVVRDTPASERTREDPDGPRVSGPSGSSRVRSDAGVQGETGTPAECDPGLGARVIGIDYTFEMLPIASLKARSAFVPVDAKFNPPLAAGDATRFLHADAQALPLPDACCDVVSIAFGIRNVADPAKAVGEFYRVLRPGGRLIVLEFSLPTNPVLRGLYNLYFRQVLPRTATLISGDKTGAYKYLPESVNTFIGREQMTGMMSAAGFADVTPHPMTFGVCVCYRGVKA